MRSAIAVGIVLVAAAACGARQSGSASKASACDVGARIAPHEARRLVAAVEQLEAAPLHGGHAPLLAAIRALEASLEVVAPDRSAELTGVHLSGTTLARALDNDDAQADFVRMGLINASQALAAVEPSLRGNGCYRTELGAMTIAASKIDPDRRLSYQYAEVTAALRAASRVVLAASTSPQIATRESR
jgi:hypothetical protein